MEIRKVIIELKSVTDGESAVYRYKGNYALRSGKHCVVYSDDSGESKTRVLLEASENGMFLHRTGGITSDMIFDPSRMTAVSYEAMSLRHDFLLITDAYTLMAETDRIRICTSYRLRIGAAPATASEDALLPQDILCTQNISIIPDHQ